MDFLITNKGIEFYVFFSNCLIYIIIFRTITKYQFGVPELPDERKNYSSWITEKKSLKKALFYFIKEKLSNLRLSLSLSLSLSLK